MSHKIEVLKPEFVEFVPDELQPGVLYVSMQFKSVQHLCCCGCGRKVVTPLSPTGWRIEFDGRSVSLKPSIGNWQKECGSHYFITNNRARWAPAWSKEEIAQGIREDVQAKQDYYAERTPAAACSTTAETPPPEVPSLLERAWRKLKKLI